MNGGVLFGIVAAAIILPVLIGTMIADLTRLQLILLAVAAALVCAYFVIGDSAAFHRVYWQWTEPAPPAAESAFIAAGDDLRRQRAAAGGALTGALRQAEARLCALPTDASGWVGRVDQIYPSNSGHAVSLAVEIWPHLLIRTALFADASDTLISGPPPLLAAATALHAGDSVRFDGRIVGRDGACPGDPPVDRNERLRDPEFLFRFTRIETAQQP